ncbi:MAG: CRISPR-associated protein Cas7 [Bacteroidales bacterium]|jgi:hypothetical protein
MKNSPFIYLRGLRYAEHTVFGVENGQKYYWDSQFNRQMAYSSGQQVKRSVMEGLTTAINVPFAAITFNWEIKDKKAEMKQPYHPCNPLHVDQLIGGYMRSVTGDVTVKRRSPLSISAMRPLHPLLGGLEREKEAANFDRKSFPANYKTSDKEENEAGANNVRVFKTVNKKQVELSNDELQKWLSSNERQLPPHYYKPESLSRASGLFVYDIAIDLRTLFCVSTNKLEPELFPEIEEKLKAENWTKGENIFGECLICPKEKRKEIIKALAHALINWRITSNQARTFSIMETMAIAMSDNANQIGYSIRGELRDDVERQQAVPVIDESAKAEIFITPKASHSIIGVVGSADALERAEQTLIDKMNAFDYENQLSKT